MSSRNARVAHTQQTSVHSNNLTQRTNEHLSKLNVTTNSLETLQTTANTTLAAILVDTDAADSSLNTIEAQSVLTASRLNNIQNKISENTDGTGETVGQMTKDIKDAQVLTNSKLDTIVTNTGNINVNVGDVEVNTNDLEVLGAATNALLQTIDNVLDVHTGHLSEVEGAVETLEGCVSSNKIQVDIVSSSLPTGGATETTLSAAEVHLGAIETATGACATDLAALEILQTATNSKLDTLNTEVDNAEAHLGNIDTATAACATDLAALEILQTSTNSKLDHLSGNLDTLETTLTAIETDQAALEVLHTATNSALGTIDGVLDNAEAHLGNIETSVQALDDIVKAEDTAHNSGDKGVMFLGVRQDSQADFGADGDYVPLSVDADGKLRVAAAAASGGATEAKQDVIETTLTAIETDAAAIEVLLTGIDSDTDAIKTAVQALDNAVDGNYLNANINIAGADVDANSGNKSGASQRVVIATDDVNMSAIKTATEASATDLAALEVLQTSTNTKLDHLSGDLDTLETTLTAIETDQAALEVLHTATNSALTTMDAVLDAIKVDTEAIETAVEAINTRDALTTTLIIDGQSVASGGGTHTSSSFEVTKLPPDGKLKFLIRISGVSTNEIGPTIQVSADDTNFFGVDLGFITQGGAVTGVGQFFTCAFPAKHFKITLSNSSFSSNATCSVHLFN